MKFNINEISFHGFNDKEREKVIDSWDEMIDCKWEFVEKHDIERGKPSEMYFLGYWEGKRRQYQDIDKIFDNGAETFEFIISQEKNEFKRKMLETALEYLLENTARIHTNRDKAFAFEEKLNSC